MALFGLTRPVSPEPVLRGDGLYLRPAALADYSSWSRLRAASRGFLEPWEPTWPDDDLTRAAFRRRLKRQDDDMARDEAYSFLIFDSVADELLGGITLGGRAARGVAERNARLLDGSPACGQRAHDARGRGDGRIRARPSCGCIGSKRPASRKMRHRSRSLERNGFRREGYARGFLKINGAWRDHVLFGLVAKRRASATGVDQS